MFVYIAVILARAESFIFLFNKEEGRGLGGIGWADLSRSEVFIQKVFGGFSFVGGEWIYFPDFWSKGVV